MLRKTGRGGENGLRRGNCGTCVMLNMLYEYSVIITEDYKNEPGMSCNQCTYIFNGKLSLQKTLEDKTVSHLGAAPLD